MNHVAVIGTGISGMACARELYPHTEVTLFEAEPRPGGHTHTVDVTEKGTEHPVDTGFMVYNEVTYPLLTRLFKDLGIKTEPTDMSFGVQHLPAGLEYCGSSLNQLFAQRKNCLRPDFLGMLRDIVRFNKLAARALADPQLLNLSLADFVQQHGFHRRFRDSYLLPMTSAIWSTPPDEMLRFPAHSLLRFLHNHGLLGVRTQHQWRTVTGGSRQYRDKLLAPFRQRLHTNCPIRTVQRSGQDVRLSDANGRHHRFDRVVIATHADQALRILADPDDREQRLLGAFPYAANIITLHTDTAVMPKTRRAWASWNYRVDALPDGQHKASTHYWMNSLQNLSTHLPYFVSVNGADLVDRDKVLKEFTFDHPMFSKHAAEAQFELPLLNENGKVYFCGSYFRYGFHEDGLMSGYAAAKRLLTHSDIHAQLPL